MWFRGVTHQPSGIDGSAGSAAGKYTSSHGMPAKLAYRIVGDHSAPRKREVCGMELWPRHPVCHIF
jgi:hypothetical protein